VIRDGIARSAASAPPLAPGDYVLALARPKDLALLDRVFLSYFALAAWVASRAPRCTEPAAGGPRVRILLPPAGVVNEPCSCRRLRLVAKQRRAFPNEKQGPGNRPAGQNWQPYAPAGSDAEAVYKCSSSLRPFNAQTCWPLRPAIGGWNSNERIGACRERETEVGFASDSPVRNSSRRPA
jgi:hypothetical protein